MKNTLISVLCLCLVLLKLSSCGPEPEPEVKIELAFVLGSLNSPAGTQPLHLLYSLDGKTFSREQPVLRRGSKLFVKVNNGTNDLSSADYNFDWSDSKPLPSDVTSDRAEFRAGDQNMTVGCYVTNR